MLKALKGKRAGKNLGHPRYELTLKDRTIELGVFIKEERTTLTETLQSLWK
jgi:hypothetical protein